MADVKIGLSQTSKPAPLAYRKFENAAILIFLPAIAGFLAVIPMSPLGTKIEAASIVFSGMIVKGLGMVLGNGQVFTPSNEATDNPTAAK